MARTSDAAFLLVIIDHETGRFTLEGPMIDDLPWVDEIVFARRAGRQISCVPIPAAPDPDGAAARLAEECKRWPSGSIVQPDSAAQLRAP
jgi:hypothetical protein